MGLALSLVRTVRVTAGIPSRGSYRGVSFVIELKVLTSEHNGQEI